MSHVGPIIAASGRLGLMTAERLLNGITPESFARLARPGGQVIQSNHPAFVFGHLSLYPTRIMTALKLPPGATAYPARFDSIFKSGSHCHDDPDGTIYPPMKELT